MIHSVAGLLEGGRLVMRPPFREPHHGACQAALAGGGMRARPGEVSLAHRGVLFLDELPEFPRQALEALRQPMESGRTTVARGDGACDLSRAVPAGGGDEPVPLRPSRRRGARVQQGAPLRRGLSWAGSAARCWTGWIWWSRCSRCAPAELSRAPPGEPSATVAEPGARWPERAQRERYGVDGAATNAEAEVGAIDAAAGCATTGGAGGGEAAPLRARVHPGAAGRADHRGPRPLGARSVAPMWRKHSPTGIACQGGSLTLPLAEGGAAGLVAGRRLPELRQQDVGTACRPPASRVTPRSSGCC